LDDPDSSTTQKFPKAHGILLFSLLVAHSLACPGLVWVQQMMIMLPDSPATCYLALEVVHLYILHSSFLQQQNMHQASRQLPDVQESL
jgi:hypothetical protein